jgi:tetratricopeptide (TPR) repeat protein
VLAAYRRPVSSDAVCFILESFEEEIDVHNLLKQLARSRYININRETQKVYLHPMDNDSIYSSILSDSSVNGFNKQHLESRIADYYVERRAPKETWINLADLEPQLLEFEHRCKADEYNKAAKVLSEIDDTLLLWGIHRRVVEQHKILQTKISDQKLQMTHLFSLSRGYRNLGYYVESIDCCNQALSIAEIHDEQGFIGGILGNLGNCYTSLGQVDEAIHYYQKALEVAINNGNRLLEAFWSNNLGVCYADLGNIEEALHYYRRALSIALENGEPETQGTCFGNLCDCYLSLGETLIAIECGEAALSIQEAIQDWIGQGTTLHSLAEAMVDEQNYEKAIEYANRGLEIGVKTENPKIKSENYCVLACTYLYQNSEKLSLAINIAKSANENNVPQNNYYASFLLGLILLKQGDKESACEAFTESIDQIKKLSVYNSKNYKILDIKWLALCGLCLCNYHEFKVTAIETYYIVKEIYKNSGIRKRTQKLFSEILLLDSDKILSDIQEILNQR